MTRSPRTLWPTSAGWRTHRIIITLALQFLAGTLAAQERITLRMTNWASLEEVPLDRAAIDTFERRHPHVRVLYEPNPGRQYEEKILTGLASGSAPDVFLLDSKLVPTFTNKGVLLDLTPFLGPLGVDTTQWFPNVLAIARRGSALYAFPKGFTPLMMYYNRALFRAAGLPYPRADWTWDEYRHASRALTRDTDGDGAIDVYGTAFTNYYFYWIVWVWSAGGDVVDPTGTHASGFLNSPETRRALQFLIDLRNADRSAPDVGTWVQAEKTGMSSQLFSSGRIGMVLDGHWRMPSFLRMARQGLLDIGVAPLPSYPGSGKVNVMYESGWCVPTISQHPREAAELAAFLAGPEAARIRSTEMLELPAVRSVAAEIVAGDSLGWERAFFEEVPYCREPWGARLERFSEVEWTLQDAVDEAMVNGIPLADALDKYAAKVDDELAGIRQTAGMTFAPIREHAEILEVLFLVAGGTFLTLALLYRRARRRARPETARAFGFLAPSLIHLVVFLGTPIAFSAYLSVHRWDLVVPDTPFVGLAQFREMFGDPGFWAALKNTLVFSLNVPAGMLLALGVALMLHRRFRGVAVLRAIYFLPSVTSFVAVALVWMWIYHPTFGAANAVLALVGLPPMAWLNSTQTAMLSVVVFTVWLGMGYQMVIFLAGLQGIPDELHEAARIDGANAWRRLVRITLPLLAPTTFFILITSLIGSFQAFTSIYVMTAGGPVGSTDVIVYHIYKAAWEQLRMGYASAMAWVLFILIMAATWIQFRFLGRNIDYS